ncbi:MAG: hypothetical protein KA215_02955 [Flavobacterium sp.]|jgi:hypothetical protein|nr:hypothetical protein [Flavobacterium sp.]
MKGVFKENKEIKYLKEEFKTFVEKKQLKKPLQTINTNEIQKETLVLEEVEL